MGLQRFTVVDGEVESVDLSFLGVGRLITEMLLGRLRLWCAERSALEGWGAFWEIMSSLVGEEDGDSRWGGWREGSGGFGGPARPKVITLGGAKEWFDDSEGAMWQSKLVKFRVALLGFGDWVGKGVIGEVDVWAVVTLEVVEVSEWFGGIDFNSDTEKFFPFFIIGAEDVGNNGGLVCGIGGIFSGIKEVQVGNPETNDYFDYKGLLEYAWSHSVESDQDYSVAKRSLIVTKKDIDMYNIYAPSCNLNATSSKADTKVLLSRMRSI
ncbi:hypothetical protein RD792_011512 [Penstemon davidsonii]|uniref:Uncharacterized protein n=1 Tax=Penstemon davidsonii TaxID=160366 RepID=A0ABR0D4T8_9LAMI|nr:hypothetical protein RD792_011512 [Penstemon davidsonii]